jgi:iron complex transport system substrate-binding protein
MTPIRLRSSRARSLLLLVALLWSCAPGSGGREAAGAAPPARIVSLAPALTEILFAVGAGSHVVGVTAFCDFPPEARLLPKVGGYTTPSIEAILALHPDLVLVSPAAGNRDSALALERAGLRVEVIPAETLAEAYAAVEEVGRLAGAEPRSRELSAAMRARIEAAARKAASLPKVRAIFCVQQDPLIVAGRGTLPAELLELAGGVNLVAADRYPRIGIETVLSEGPDVIVQSRMDLADPREEVAALEFWKRWPTIPAVRGSRVFVIDGTTAFRAGPRVADAVEMLSEILHGAPR